MQLSQAQGQPTPSIAEPPQCDAPKLWFDGQLIDVAAPQAPLTTHAMHYGSGVFEGIRSYATRDGAAVFRLPEHLDRMRRGAELLGIAFDAPRAAAATLRSEEHTSELQSLMRNSYAVF